MIIYHTDEYPAFVDGTGKEDYVPSRNLLFKTSVCRFGVSSLDRHINTERSRGSSIIEEWKGVVESSGKC